MSRSQKHFELHFNPDITKLMMPAEIVHKPAQIRSLQIYLQAKKITNLVTGNLIKLEKAKKINKASLDIDTGILKIEHPILEFKNKFHNFMKKVRNQKRIFVGFNAPWKQKGSHQDANIHAGISVDSVMVKVLTNIILIMASGE